MIAVEELRFDYISQALVNFSFDFARKLSYFGDIWSPPLHKHGLLFHLFRAPRYRKDEEVVAPGIHSLLSLMDMEG